MSIVRKPYSVNKQIAIKQPVFEKIETETKHGFAFNANRIKLITAEVTMDYMDGAFRLNAGDFVILAGDSGAKPWSKKVYVIDDKEFVLCPEGDIIGYTSDSFEVD